MQPLQLVLGHRVEVDASNALRGTRALEPTKENRQHGGMLKNVGTVGSSPSTDTPTDEIARLRARVYADSETGLPAPPPPRTRIERRLRDGDALLEIDSGRRVHRKGAEARDKPARFVEINPDGVRRTDAVVATMELTELGDDLKPARVLHCGEWIHRDDPFVLVHPHAFELSPLGETED